jgi:hypothetical protein
VLEQTVPLLFTRYAVRRTAGAASIAAASGRVSFHLRDGEGYLTLVKRPRRRRPVRVVRRHGGLPPTDFHVQGTFQGAHPTRSTASCVRRRRPVHPGGGGWPAQRSRDAPSATAPTAISTIDSTITKGETSGQGDLSKQMRRSRPVSTVTIEQVISAGIITELFGMAVSSMLLDATMATCVRKPEFIARPNRATTSGPRPRCCRSAGLAQAAYEAHVVARRTVSARTTSAEVLKNPSWSRAGSARREARAAAPHRPI